MGQDIVMSKLNKMVLRGWPDVDQDLQAYWTFRDELCICDGLLMKGDRLITPPNRANDCLFWPGITKQIQEKVEKCQICKRYIGIASERTINAT